MTENETFFMDEGKKRRNLFQYHQIRVMDELWYEMVLNGEFIQNFTLKCCIICIKSKVKQMGCIICSWMNYVTFYQCLKL